MAAANGPGKLEPELDEPLDLERLSEAADRPGECCVVRRRWLQQVLRELKAGRAAMAQQGLTFSRVTL